MWGEGGCVVAYYKRKNKNDGRPSSNSPPWLLVTTVISNQNSEVKHTHTHTRARAGNGGRDTYIPTHCVCVCVCMFPAGSMAGLAHTPVKLASRYGEKKKKVGALSCWLIVATINPSPSIHPSRPGPARPRKRESLRLKTC